MGDTRQCNNAYSCIIFIFPMDLLYHFFISGSSADCIPKTGGPLWTKGDKCIFPYISNGKTCPGPKCCNLDNDAKGSWCAIKVEKGVIIPSAYGYCKDTHCDEGGTAYTLFFIRKLAPPPRSKILVIR